MRRKVRVTEQLQFVDGVWHRRPPKTNAGIRSITISAHTAAALAEYLAGRPTDDALVFTTTTGAALIHASVALAIAAGAHPKAIQVRMGHSSITVTLDRSGRLFPELDEAIAVCFNQGWAEARAAAGIA